MMEAHRRGLAFTLVELLVSLAIVVSLVTAATAIYSAYARDANIQVLRADLYMLRTAIQRFYQDQGRYPFHGRDVYGNVVSFLDNDSSELVQGVHDGANRYPERRHRYLQEMPLDPSTNLPDWVLLTGTLEVPYGTSVVRTTIVTNVTSRNPAFKDL
jgi:type II secretory pathway pseudopilin PulG